MNDLAHVEETAGQPPLHRLLSDLDREQLRDLVLQVAAQVIGNDTAVMLAGQGGNFELNTMMPLIAYNLMQSIHLMDLGVRSFAEKCIKGISANRETCESYVDKSLAIATYLVPILGYDRVAAVSKKAHETGRRIREVVVEEGIMTGEAFDKLLG